MNHTITCPTARFDCPSTRWAGLPPVERSPESPCTRPPDVEAPSDLTVASGDPHSARAVRDFVRLRLTDLGALSDVVDDAVLLVSELHGNAVRHAPGTDITVRFVHDPKRSLFTVAVQDHGHAHPRAAGPDDPAELKDSGRGLTLVAALATDWGRHPLPDGKAVWFTLDLSRAPSLGDCPIDEGTPGPRSRSHPVECCR
ncbi:ATP-binding protein (plasmid) [Embleya sp. NBC_00888]|uniref:ATP-binding protein n=1 Tax=Embleya sp. NBC_00888 TaxID=2975960 RepID=UPI002F911E97|nr:ATP-binding protein [Embleya sp. NBC_00888]